MQFLQSSMFNISQPQISYDMHILHAIAGIALMATAGNVQMSRAMNWMQKNVAMKNCHLLSRKAYQYTEKHPKPNLQLIRVINHWDEGTIQPQKTHYNRQKQPFAL